MNLKVLVNIKPWFGVRGQREVGGWYQVQCGGQDGGVRDGPGLTAVEQELEALHALPDGPQVHHVLVLHGLLTGGQTLLEAMMPCRRNRRRRTEVGGQRTEEEEGEKEKRWRNEGGMK